MYVGVYPNPVVSDNESATIAAKITLSSTQYYKMLFQIFEIDHFCEWASTDFIINTHSNWISKLIA